ncbi:MAG: hypothetical protein ACYTBY_10740, partial [Planctomycetota bacterium]
MIETTENLQFRQRVNVFLAVVLRLNRPNLDRADARPECVLRDRDCRISWGGGGANFQKSNGMDSSSLYRHRCAKLIVSLTVNEKEESTMKINRVG